MRTVQTYAPALMSKDAAAAYLDMSVRTFEDVNKRGELIPRKFGSQRKWTRADLDEFAENLPDWERA